MFLGLGFPTELNLQISLYLNLISALRLGQVNKLGNGLVNSMFGKHSPWKHKTLLSRLKHFWMESNWELTDAEIEHFFKYNKINEHIKEWGMPFHREQFGDCCRTTYFKELLIHFWELGENTLLDNPMKLFDYSELLELVVVKHTANLEKNNPNYDNDLLLQHLSVEHKARWEIVSSKQDSTEKHYYIKLTYKAMTKAQCLRLIDLLNESHDAMIAHKENPQSKLSTFFNSSSEIQDCHSKSIFYLRVDLFCSKILGLLEPLNQLVNLKDLECTALSKTCETNQI